MIPSPFFVIDGSLFTIDVEDGRPQGKLFHPKYAAREGNFHQRFSKIITRYKSDQQQVERNQ